MVPWVPWSHNLSSKSGCIKRRCYYTLRGFPGGASGEEPTCQWRRYKRVSIPGWGRSPGVGHGNPLQYSCLRNPMDRGAWRAIVQRVTKSLIGLKQLSTHKNWYIDIILVYNTLKRMFSSFCGVFKRLPRLRSTQTVTIYGGSKSHHHVRTNWENKGWEFRVLEYFCLVALTVCNEKQILLWFKH